MEQSSGDFELLLRLSLDSAAQGTWEWAPVEGRAGWSAKTAALLGISKGGTGDLAAMLSTFEPKDRMEIHRRLQLLGEGKGELDILVQARHGDGSVHGLRIRGVHAGMREGRPARVIGVVAENNQWAGALGDHLAAITSASDDAIINKTLDGTITSWNKGAERIFGYTADEMIGRPIATLAVPGEEDDMPAIMEKIRRGRRVDHYQTKRRHKNGATLDILLTVVPAHDSLGNVTGASKIARDVTLARRSQLDIAGREAHLRSILEAIPDGMVIIDERGIIQSFSPAAERLFGYSASEVIGKNIGILMPSPDREAHDDYISRYLATGQRRIIGIGRTVVGRKKDGSEFPMDLSVGEARSDGRRIFTGFVRDLTEQRQKEARLIELQSELLHVSRLSAMGQMATMLAHELNQPLTAVMNYAEAARQMLATAAAPPDARAVEFLQKASGQAERAGQIIRRLRAFVEKRTVDHSMELMNGLVEEASNLASVGARLDGIRLEFDLAPDLAPIALDRIQIQQVVVNLVRNAVEALRDAERRIVTVRTRNAEAGHQEVAIIDTGPGIAPEVAKQLFKPFVTTKSDGMGIGLSVCRSIIEAHGGRLWAEANPDGGTIFRFNLPATGAFEIRL